MRSRTARNITYVILGAIILAETAFILSPRHSDGNSSNGALSAQVVSLQRTVASLATENQSNYGRADRLEQEQLKARTDEWNSDYNIATAASTITHNAQVGAPSSEIIPTVAYYAKLVLASGKAWTSHVIPRSYLSDVADNGTVYHLSPGTSWDGQPAVYVSQAMVG